MTSRHIPFRRGLTLIQLLVILALLAFLLAFLLPAVAKVRGAAGRTQTMNNLKQIGLALHNCNDVYRLLPPAFDKYGGVKFPAAIHVHILPFLEQNDLYTQIMNKKGDVPEATVMTYLSPQDQSTKDNMNGIQNYAANLRVFADSGVKTAYDKNMPAPKAVEPGTASIPRTFVDGTSNTIVYATKIGICGDGGSKYASAVNTKTAAFLGQNAAMEKASPASPKATFQLAPTGKDCLCSPLMAQSFDKSGLAVGLADGSVRMVSPQISAATWNMVLQPNDGMVLGKDWDFGKK